MNDGQMTAKIVLSAVDQASGTFRNVMGAADGLAGKLAGLAGITAGGLGFGAMVREGVQFASMMEDAQIGIAGVVGSMTRYRDETGATITGQKAFGLAMADSEAIMADLRTRALETKATLSEMVEAFQVGVQPLGMAGIKLTEIAEATQRLTQVAGAAGVPLAQLGVELRQFAKGDEVRGRLVQVLGYTKETIKELSASGTLMEDLRKRTDAFAMAAAASAETMTGRWSNFKDAIQQILGLASSGLYEKLKTSLRDISSIFVTFGRSDTGALTATFNPEIVARVRGVADAIGEAVGRFKEMAPAAVDFGLSLSESVGKVVGLFAQLPFASTLKLITDLNDATAGWAGALYLATKGANGLAIALGQTSIVAFGSTLWAQAAVQIGVVIGFMGELTAGIVAATGASAGLAAGIAAFSTAGLFAAAIWGVTQIAEGLGVAAELFRELKKEAASGAAAVDGMITGLDALAKRFDVIGPLTEKQIDAMKKLREVQNLARIDIAANGKISENTDMRYRMLLQTIGEVAPAIRASGITSESKKAGDATKEAAEAALKAQETYGRLFGRIRNAKEEADLDGIALAFAKITNAIAAQREELRKLAKDGAKVGKEAYDFLDSTESAQKVKALTAALKDQAKVYASFPSAVKNAKEWGDAFVETLETIRADSANRLRDLLADAGAAPATVAAATLEALQDSLGTFNDDVSRMMSSLWGNSLRLFDDLFFSVLTGRFEDLGGVFKAFGESILRSWSETLSNMVMRAMQGLDVLNGGNGNIGTKTGKVGGAGILGYVGAAGAGYGIGSGIGGGGQGNQWGGAVGAIGGMALGSTAGVVTGVGAALGLGAAAGSVVPIIGTIIGAIIGAIIGGLFNKNTEKDVRFSGAFVGNGQASYADPIRQRQNAMQGGVLDLFRMSGEKDMTGKAEWVASVLKGVVQSGDYEAFAGGDKELQTAISRLLANDIPKVMLHELFGSRQTGKEEQIGNLRGVPEYVKGSFDAGAPIPVMLDGLKVTAERIREIAGLIDSRSPEEFMAYLKRFVGLVVGLDEMSAAMAKSGDELLAVIAERENADPVEAFKKSAADISSRVDELSFYSGDEQMARAEEVLAMARERYEAELQYIAKIRDTMKAVSSSIDAQLKKWDEAGLSRDATLSLRRNDADGTWGKLFGATTPEGVAQAAAEGQAAAEALLTMLSSKLSELVALSAALDRTKADFSSFGIEGPSGLAAIRAESRAMFTDIGNLASLSGDEQIAAIARVNASATDLYASMTSMLQSVRQNAEDLKTSIDRQIWGIDYEEKDSSGKVGMIEGRLAELYNRLANATNPDEMRALTDEMQSLGGQYLGLFGKDDPRRQEAIDWLKGMLKDTEALGLGKYAGMEDELKSLAKKIGAQLEPVSGLLSKAITETEAEIQKWKGFLRDLRTHADEKLRGMIDAIVATNDELRTKLNAAADLFKKASEDMAGAVSGGGGAGGTGGGGRQPVVPALNTAASAASDFATALVEATARINGANPGASGGVAPVNVTANVSPQSSMTAREVVSVVRRNLRSLAPRTA